MTSKDTTKLGSFFENPASKGNKFSINTGACSQRLAGHENSSGNS